MKDRVPRQQREVDFVLKEGLEFEQLIQVTYAVDRDEMERREVEAQRLQTSSTVKDWIILGL